MCKFSLVNVRKEELQVNLKFDYYYGAEAEQFSFYRVPRMLIKDENFKGLSSDAKLLYGLMLDRMSLSIKNGWFDNDNRAYIIYTIDSIMEDLGCGKDKAVKVVAELDQKKGIGLIEKVRRGLGKPDLIYVKNFINSKKETINTDKSTEVGKTEFKKLEKSNSGSRENRNQAVDKVEFNNTDKPTFGSLEKGLQEVGNTESNYTNNNYTDNSDNNLIYLSLEDGIDGNDDIQKYIKLLKRNLEYDFFMEHGDQITKEYFQEIYDVICDVVCVKRKSVRIGGEDYPYQMVRDRFLRLNHSHLEYVMECLKSTTTKKYNIKAYLITTLYYAPSTINHYYQQEVQHDLYDSN
jgi:hypothetical protein